MEIMQGPNAIPYVSGYCTKGEPGVLAALEEAQAQERQARRLEETPAEIDMLRLYTHNRVCTATEAFGRILEHQPLVHGPPVQTLPIKTLADAQVCLSVSAHAIWPLMPFVRS